MEATEPFHLVKRALTQSAHVLSREPTQLGPQLYSRLLSAGGQELAEFRDRLLGTLRVHGAAVAGSYPG